MEISVNETPLEQISLNDIKPANDENESSFQVAVESEDSEESDDSEE